MQIIHGNEEWASIGMRITEGQGKVRGSKEVDHQITSTPARNMLDRGPPATTVTENQARCQFGCRLENVVEGRFMST